MKRRIIWKKAIYLLMVSLPVFIVDFLTKKWALINKLEIRKNPIEVLSWFHLTYAENRGALWGLGNTFSETMRQVVFVGISSIISLGVLYYFMTAKTNKRINIVFALIIGGAAGNIFDRFFRGFVVDFIDWHYKNVYHWPTFNIADAAIVAAAVLIGIELIIEMKNEKKKKAEALKN